MADPTYEQTKAQGSKPRPSRNSKATKSLPLQVNPDSRAVSTSSEAPPSASIVASTGRKRAGAPPIEAAAKQAATVKPAGAAPPKKKNKTRHAPPPAMSVEINSAYFVLQQSLTFQEWSETLDSVAIVEDSRRMPIYHYRLLDSTVNSVTDAAGYGRFLKCFNDGLLQTEGPLDSVHIDRVLSFKIHFRGIADY
jgi:hypothetical protein